MIFRKLLLKSKIFNQPKQLQKTNSHLFFWSKKNQQKEQQSKKQGQKNNSDDETNWENIGKLINQMKENNSKKAPIIPPKQQSESHKLTAVFELDETLIYSFAPDEHEAYMEIYQYFLYFQKEFDTYVNIYKRPNLDKFMEYLKNETESILYTNGQESYVNLVLDLLDPNRDVFKHVIPREKGSTRIIDEKENMDEFFKDLNLLNRDPKKLVYIDCKPLNFWPMPDNSMPVTEYLADSTLEDNELMQLIEFLEELKKDDDVRIYLKERFQIRQALIDTKML